MCGGITWITPSYINTTLDDCSIEYQSFENDLYFLESNVLGKEDFQNSKHMKTLNRTMADNRPIG